MSDNRKYIQAQKFKLAGSGISATDTSITLQSFMTPNSETIAMTDIGTLGFGSLGPGTSREEIISFTGVTQNADGTATLTGVTRGLDFRSPYTQDTALRKSHSGNETFILTNNPQFYDSFFNKENDETVNGATTFTQVPTTNGGDAVVANGLVRLAQLQAAVLGSLTNLAIVSPGTAGETVAEGNLIYFKAADARWWKCDADTAATVDNILLGIAQGAGTAGNAITDGVLLFGMDTNQTGLSAGSTYYAGNTAGAISPTPGTVEVTIGQANTTTDLYFSPRYNQQLTEDQQDALAGTSGTPSASNKFVTNDDTSNAGVADKVVRAVGTKLPALDGSDLTGINPSVTLGEDVVAGDLLKLVNESGNARLKKLIGTPSSTSTASGGTIGGGLMNVWLSSNLCIFAWKESGSTDMGVVAGTYSGGTWTFGTDVQYTVGAGIFYNFGLTRVSSTGFAVVMRSATNGGAGNYLYGVAGTVSGTTITSGSVTTLDSNANTGDNNPRLLKLFTLPGTSTCVCTYRFQTASTCIRSILFTVSGTAITGGSPSDADTGNVYGAVTGCPLSASKFVVAFSDDGASTRKVRVATISGTTITYGTLTTVTFTSGNFSATQLDTDAFVLVGKDVSTTTTMLKRIFTVSSTTVTQGTLYTDTTSMTSGTGKDFSVAIIGTILYVIRTSSGTVYFYKYRYNSTDGTFILIASYSSSTLAPLLAIDSLYAANVYNSDRLIISSSNSNNIINVVGLPDWDEFLTSSNSTLLSGVSLVVTKIMTGFSSLIPSARYYVKTDMTTQGVTTDSTYQYVGRAISATTIYNDNQ